ncbi:MAG: molybdenum cofactor biosynthesis protein MoaB [Rhodothermia bacterium]|nr:molybdenum cofactor biosynthesis protein MoaB [Rhodothermia bacterium]
MGSEEHRQKAADTPVVCAVLTVSDTRNETTDKSGRYILDALGATDSEIGGYEIVSDDPALVRSTAERLCASSDVLLINGGTGISKRDTTYEAIQSLLEKTLPGFGEIFRVMSYDDVGPAAMLSRATAGVYNDTVIFSMPGSLGAVRLAMEKLILPELKHLVWELVRQRH